MRGCVMLKIAHSAREHDIGSPPTWHTLYLRSVGLVEMSRCRWADLFSFVWMSFGLDMSVTPPSVG